MLRVVRGKSLIQLSYERLRAALPPEQIFVCTNDTHRAAVLENLPELPPQNLLGEPEGRDTANAVGFPAAVLASRDKDAVAAFITADHVIEPIETFQTALRTAFDVIAEQPQTLVTFGIVPTHGHPGLGYIHRGEELRTRRGHRGAYRVIEFIEKPEKAQADRFVESRRYYWNSGMFVWRCDVVRDELAIHLPASQAGLAQIADAWGTPRQDEVLRRIYPQLPKISIDYALMEPASKEKGKARVVVVEMPVEWLDVGSWTTLSETFDTDGHDNAINCPTCVLLDSDGNIVVSDDPEHLVSTMGVSEMIIVHTRDATLVCPRAEAQRLKDLVGKVKEKYGARFQ